MACAANVSHLSLCGGSGRSLGGGTAVEGVAAEVPNYDLHHLWSAGQK